MPLRNVALVCLLLASLWSPVWAEAYDDRSVELVSAKAQKTLGPHRYYRKLSRKLRGRDPSPSEWQNLSETLAQRSESELSSFFNSEIESFLADAGHVEKMSYRINKLMGIDAVFVPPAYNNFSTDSSLIREMARALVLNNGSWDRLLTTDVYYLSSDFLEFPYNEVIEKGLAKKVTPEELAGGGAEKYPELQSLIRYRGMPFALIDFTGAGEDLSSGVLTTTDWKIRYTASEINANRRNAAGIYRHFLCDPMVPNLEPEPSADAGVVERLIDAIEKLLGIEGRLARFEVYSPIAPNYHEPLEITEFNLRQQLSEGDPHGQNPACMSCHVKLDPAGRVFGPVSYSIPSVPNPGHLHYDYGSGHQVDIPVAHISQMGKEIVQQRRYLQCQVRHFWDWFISREATLRPSAERIDELVQNFENSGRRVNSFVSYLVQQPEFRIDQFGSTEPDTGDDPIVPPSYDEVKPLLNKCQSCHANFGPDFTDVSLPNLGTEEDFLRLQKMWSRLNRKDGAPGAMPPNRGSWDPGELELIKAWVKPELDSFGGQR